MSKVEKLLEAIKGLGFGRVKPSASMELGLDKPGSYSYNMDVISSIRKGIERNKDFRFLDIKSTSNGIEGIILYKQPNDKVGRYKITLEKVSI